MNIVAMTWSRRLPTAVVHFRPRPQTTVYGVGTKSSGSICLHRGFSSRNADSVDTRRENADALLVLANDPLFFEPKREEETADEEDVAVIGVGLDDEDDVAEDAFVNAVNDVVGIGIPLLPKWTGVGIL